jgi:peptidoglycan hydrolase-like protein with peptidoglycan-binding domain
MRATGRVTTALAATVSAGVLAGGAVLGAQLWQSGDGRASLEPSSRAAAADTASPTRTPAATATRAAPQPKPKPKPAAKRAPARTASPTAEPTREPTHEPTHAPSHEPTAEPTPEATPEPQAGPPLLQRGDTSRAVRELQARLAAIDWFARTPTGTYGPVTAAAVSGFQAKRGIPVTGYVDRETLDRLHAMTAEPTQAQLYPPAVTTTAAAPSVDPRCLSGRVLCIDKSSATLRWVVDGSVRQSLDVRFGSEFTPTREGRFSIFRKVPDGVSNLYGSRMPYAMYFSGGQAVHYSSDFAARGYAGASHGCINVRDFGGIQSLYAQVDIGTQVIIYRS